VSAGDFDILLQEVDSDPPGFSSADHVGPGGPMSLPSNLDQEKLSQAALAILGLTAHRDHQIVRVWKGMDWDLLDVLFEQGWIFDPKGKAKSVVLTAEGARLAEEFLTKHFGK
jgi:hypothetical protein